MAPTICCVWISLGQLLRFLMPCLRQLAYHTTLNFFCKAFFKEFCKNFYFFIFRPFIVQYVCFICIFIPNFTQAPYASIPISRWMYFRYFRSLASFKGDKVMELSHPQRTEHQRKKRKEVEHPSPKTLIVRYPHLCARACVCVRFLFVHTRACVCSTIWSIIISDFIGFLDNKPIVSLLYNLTS